MQKNSSTVSLRQIVETYDQLLVDDYQRTYQWVSDQIDDLMQDLLDTVDQNDDHFFGTLILQESDSRKATIVDGQQRLTTVFMFVAALRDEMLATGLESLQTQNQEVMPVNVAEKLRKFLYFSNKYSDTRLTPNRFVRDLFAEIVMATKNKQKGIPQKHRRSTLAFRKAIGRTRELVANELGSLDSEPRLARINTLIDTLFDRFLVLKVATSSINESLEIFLTLNDRGQALGPSDLVRGEVLSARGLGQTDDTQKKLQEEVATEWEEVMETVVEPETFLRHFLVARTGTKIQKKKVLKTVKEIIVGNTTEEKRLAAAVFWDDLTSAAETYGEIIKPSGQGKIRNYLELVQPLAKSQRIMLLPVMKIVDDPISRTELVRLIVVLAFRWVVAGGNAQKLEDFFQEQCWFSKDPDFPEILAENLRDKIDSFAVDTGTYFRQEAGTSYVVRALLFAVDRILRGAANPLALDPGTIHLEHIAPQKATDHWRLVIAPEDGKENYSAIVNLPGNLTLLDYKLNIQAQRKPFIKKRDEEYKKSNSVITRDLQDFSSWDENLIDQRTTWLSEMFDLVWSTKEQNQEKVVGFGKWIQSKAG